MGVIIKFNIFPRLCQNKNHKHITIYQGCSMFPALKIQESRSITLRQYNGI